MGYLRVYRSNIIQNKENATFLSKASFATVPTLGAFYFITNDLDWLHSMLFNFACLGTLVSAVYGIMGLLVYGYIGTLGKSQLKNYSKIDFGFIFLAQACAMMVTLIFFLCLLVV